MADPDLWLLSCGWIDQEIPKDKRYLLKYFTTALQFAFLKYFLLTGSRKNFIDHTGWYCGERLLLKFEERYHTLTKLYETSKMSLTEEGMETVFRIEAGEMTLAEIDQRTKEG